MRVLNYGSLNIDRVYSVDHFVRAGETITCSALNFYCGGKGLNQSVALARAGCNTVHFGAVGQGGDMLREQIAAAGADVSEIMTLEGESGHAVIQVNDGGNNCIIVYGGANRKITRGDIDRVLAKFTPGDCFLCQNETSEVPYAIHAAKQRRLYVVVNPSPIDEVMCNLPAEDIDCFVLNEIEAKALSQSSSDDYHDILFAMHRRYPKTRIVMTVGEAGVLCADGDHVYEHGIFKVNAVDTTAAGDTFCGYIISCMQRGLEMPEALRIASAAGAIAVGRAGASVSIPLWDEVMGFLRERG